MTSESAAATQAPAPDDDDYVEVRLPADGAYLSVLRTASAGLAARLDFTIDEIDDLRIAVDEACALLMAQVVPDGLLSCRFTMSEDSLSIAVSVPTRDGHTPARDTFAWTVLAALADTVEAFVDDERTVTITLRKRRGGTT